MFGERSPTDRSSAGARLANHERKISELADPDPPGENRMIWRRNHDQFVIGPWLDGDSRVSDWPFDKRDIYA